MREGEDEGGRGGGREGEGEREVGRGLRVKKVGRGGKSVWKTSVTMKCLPLAYFCHREEEESERRRNKRYMREKERE